MTAVVISERLRTIAGFCREGKSVADIGSDHALLATYLLQNGIAPFVIAGELNEGPYLAAKQQLANWEAKHLASVRKGDGLAVIDEGEVDTICIAGMGGQLIVSILEQGKEKLANIDRLILQPNVGSELVRSWMIENGWRLITETILEEDDIIYEILVAEQGEPTVPYLGFERTLPELLRIGPYLWRDRSPVLLKKWQRERDKLEYMLSQLEKSDRTEIKERIHLVKQELKWIDEVMMCLRTDKQ